MNHNDLLTLYSEIIGLEGFSDAVWFPNGKNSIRVRYPNKMELVFTYEDVTHWRLETVAEFLKSRKGGK